MPHFPLDLRRSPCPPPPPQQQSPQASACRRQPWGTTRRAARSAREEQPQQYEAMTKAPPWCSRSCEEPGLAAPIDVATEPRFGDCRHAERAMACATRRRRNSRRTRGMAGVCALLSGRSCGADACDGEVSEWCHFARVHRRWRRRTMRRCTPPRAGTSLALLLLLPASARRAASLSPTHRPAAPPASRCTCYLSAAAARA